MGDWYDVILTVDLRPDVPAAELAELRWHLGLGERPPDEFDPVHQLIAWLAQQADRGRSGDRLGSIRFFEDNQTEPLVVRDDQVYRGNTPLD